MGPRRKHLGVAVYNNMIYAVGGRDDTTELSSAERYNPQTNTWQPVVAMTSRRSGVGYMSWLSCVNWVSCVNLDILCVFEYIACVSFGILCKFGDLV